MSGGEDIVREQSSGQGEGEGKRRTLQRSESTAYKSCLFALIFFFLPESSFYPGLNGVNSILDVESDNLADSFPDESQFEDEDDWIGVPSTGEASQVHLSKFSEAVANEVSFFIPHEKAHLTATLTETNPEDFTSRKWTDIYHLWERYRA